jgi:hypothetical protein
MNLLKKINLVLAQPGILFRYRSSRLRKYYYHFSKFMHYKTYKKRKFKIISQSDISQNGYLKITPAELQAIGIDSLKVINEIEILEKRCPKITDYDKPIISILKSVNFDTESETFKFVTNKSLVDIISSYLGVIPLLTHISLWLSPNKFEIDDSSQFYHLDHEDYKQIKGFFLIEDLTKENGPTIILNSKNSKEVLQNLNYSTKKSNKRIKDSIVENFFKNESISCTGEKGTLYLIDTSSCFHFGSRKSLKSRKVLSFQYITPFSTSLKWNWKKSEILNKPFWLNNKLSEEQKKIIGII